MRQESNGNKKALGTCEGCSTDSVLCRILKPDWNLLHNFGIWSVCEKSILEIKGRLDMGQRDTVSELEMNNNIGIHHMRDHNYTEDELDS